MKRYFLFCMLLIVIGMHAQSKDETVLVHVNGEPLASILSESQRAKITDLKVSGVLTSEDIVTLRSMAGATDTAYISLVFNPAINAYIDSLYCGKTSGRLRRLDLSEARVKWIPDKTNIYLTIKNLRLFNSEQYGIYDGRMMFAFCHNLEKVIPPYNLGFCEKMFYDCPNIKEIEIPPFILYKLYNSYDSDRPWLSGVKGAFDGMGSPKQTLVINRPVILKRETLRGCNITEIHCNVDEPEDYIRLGATLKTDSFYNYFDPEQGKIVTLRTDKDTFCIYGVNEDCVIKYPTNYRYVDDLKSHSQLKHYRVEQGDWSLPENNDFVPEPEDKQYVFHNYDTRLKDLIPPDKVNSITNLKITGIVEEEDLHLIRAMGGAGTPIFYNEERSRRNGDLTLSSYYTEKTGGNLRILDLSEAQIYYPEWMPLWRETVFTWDINWNWKYSGLSSYDKPFYGILEYCEKLRKVYLPIDSTNIFRGFLAGCPNINTYIISRNDHSLGFFGGGYAPKNEITVLITSNVEYLSDHAIGGLRNDSGQPLKTVKYIYVDSEEPPVLGHWNYNVQHPDSTCFESVMDDAIIYVPKGSKEAYQNAALWRDYEIREIEKMPFPRVYITGLEKVTRTKEDAVEVGRFTVDGRRITSPQRGLQIVRYSDGTSRKILVK